ncbi:MAG: PD40 domain-containing protein [Chloroflexi bacterium]|nr:PD40 domain-containing protein [Chloroflexota bacterium]
MTTAPESSKPNRRPWIVVGVLGCLVVCLLIALVAAAGYFVLLPQLTPVAVSLPSPTRVPFGLPSSTPTLVARTPTAAEPTKASASPTRTVGPTLPGDVLGVPPTTAPTTAPLVTATATRPAASPTPAAPKGKIAFSRCEGTCDQDGQKTVWIMNMDGSGARKLLDRASSPSFSPDGTKLAYFRWVDGIFVANADGTEAPGKKIVGDTFTRFLDWSHDGRWIAFTAQPGGSGNVVIDVAPPDGAAVKDAGARRNVAIGLSPAWSPDDMQVVFATCRGGCGIFKGNSSGGDAIPIITDDGGLPDWSPDGKKILYQKEADGQKQLFLINPDGSGKKQLTSGPVMHVAATWSPDGNFIFYRSPEGGTWGIWRMNADGTNPIRLLENVPPVDWAYERLAVSK